MTTPNPHTTGETLEQLLERVIFEDPATHRLRDEWEESKRTEQEVFDRVCREEYERRVEYHQICQTPDPEETARRETNLCTILFQEELDGRLMVLWQDIMRRVRAVLADKGAEAEKTPGSGSCGDPAGSSGT
jgi:hypothetical protein